MAMQEPLLPEKAAILVSIMAALPLFFLDGRILGIKRYAWLVAFSAGFTRMVFSDNEHIDEETAIWLDKITMASASMAVIPHYVKLMEENLWLGGAALPPLLLAGFLGNSTEQGSAEYWKLRAFMFMATFFIPYLNHLPSGSREELPEEKPTENADEGDEDKQKKKPTTTTTTSNAQSRRSNKKKR
jgi:hypothetical protein